MSLVTACIRPSGTSYRDELLARKQHKNPSEIIDELLKDNLGYLVYQEDTIKFLQQICGLSGSAADNIRRAIGRKQRDRLEAALPQILDGYCSKSTKERSVAENEAKEFLQILEDSASYQFGYNHSIAYCLLGYLCAYYRHYYPLEYITAFLNNAANDDDIQNGTHLAKLMNARVTSPKWGVSKWEYAYDKDRHVIAQGLGSIKFMGAAVIEELAELYAKHYTCFIDLLFDIDTQTHLDSRQLDILIKLDYFSEFGNQRELLRIVDLFNLFKKGQAKQIRRSQVDGTPLEPIVERYATGVTKSGGIAKSYTLLDVPAVLREAERAVLQMGLPDLDDLVKVQNCLEITGYLSYISGKEEDRTKLYITDIKPLKRKKDGKQFGYSVFTKSIGSGKEARFTLFNELFNKSPIQKNDIILCTGFRRDGAYFTLTGYRKVA